MDPQTKLENDYVQKTLKFHNILIVASYVSIGAHPVTKGGENEVPNVNCMGNFENHRNDPG